MRPEPFDRFLSRIKYKPVNASYDDYDDFYMATFRKRNNKEPSLEFGNHVSDEGFQNIYFEIIDWNNYKDGTVIGINDSRRKSVVMSRCKGELDYEETALKISKELKELYSETNRKENA